ncbi:hypothetical protein QYF36_004519 [Acer negundo]|nr:hypothetical protein QYF36_004519 [Acer negundo]
MKSCSAKSPNSKPYALTNPKPSRESPFGRQQPATVAPHAVVHWSSAGSCPAAPPSSHTFSRSRSPGGFRQSKDFVSLSLISKNESFSN